MDVVSRKRHAETPRWVPRLAILFRAAAADCPCRGGGRDLPPMQLSCVLSKAKSSSRFKPLKVGGWVGERCVCGHQRAKRVPMTLIEELLNAMQELVLGVSSSKMIDLRGPNTPDT